MNISVIIPVYNNEQTIGQTLKALGAQEEGGNLEVIVVDDGSTDRSAAVIRSFPGVRYLYQPNQGPAAARNRGAEAAEGTILLFTDSDCIPRSDWAARMARAFKDPQVAVISGTYTNQRKGNPLAECIQKEIEFRHLRLPEFPKVFGSYNFGIRSKIFRELGGFDQTYRFASGEDNALSYQVLDRGYVIRFDPDITVAHHHTCNTLRYLREQFRHGFWRAKMYARFPHMAKGDGYTFWKDSVETFLVFAQILTLPFGLVISVAAVLFRTLILILILIQIYFSFRIVTPKSLAPYFALVMFFRAYARAFGFLGGLAVFLFRLSFRA